MKSGASIASSKDTNKPKQVVYLLGAGATHAEVVNVYPEKQSEGAFWEDRSLLLAKVSKRVCKAVRAEIPRHIARMLSPVGLSNLELFISLLEENHIQSAQGVVRRLKGRLQKDIVERLGRRRQRFCLHKALFEFHDLVKSETLSGVITLNYDDVVDEAYTEIFGTKPNYCLTSDGAAMTVPLLKLHGGFSLRYRRRPLPIITPGVDKNYLALPYSFVWGRALELLLECDVLRIVGCSLSQNDLGIVDLLFKAHTSRPHPPVLQIVDFDPDYNPVRTHLGFFPNIETALNIEGRLIADEDIRHADRGSNPFKIWLKAKIEKSLTPAQISRTKFIRKVVV